MLMKISVRCLHNYMIKPSKNDGLVSVVDSVTQKLLIIDKTLRLFIPPQVRKMTPKLRHICGCELYIISKYMQIDLNIFINIYKIIMLGDILSTVYLVIQSMYITKIIISRW